MSASAVQLLKGGHEGLIALAGGSTPGLAPDAVQLALPLGGISFRWVRDGAGLAALGRQWDPLLERCETVTPFMRWDWVWAWWQAHEDLFQPAICVAEEAGRVVALAPFALGREERGSRRGLRQLGLMAGLGEAQGERMNLLIPAGRVAELAPPLLGCLGDLRGQWDSVRLNRIPAESGILVHLLDALRQNSMRSGILNATPCRFLRMEGDTWEAFEASRSRNWRRKQKQVKKELSERFGATYHTGGLTAAGEDVAEALFSLHAAQFQGRESHFINERALKVHRALIPLWQACGRSEMCYVMAGGKIISVVQMLKEGGEAHAFQVGRDLQFEESSVGRAAFGWAIEHAFRSGARSVDFLAGDYEYKRRWTPETRTVLDLEGYNPRSPRARLFLLLRWLRRLVARRQAAPQNAAESAAD